MSFLDPCFTLYKCNLYVIDLVSILRSLVRAQDTTYGQNYNFLRARFSHRYYTSRNVWFSQLWIIYHARVTQYSSTIGLLWFLHSPIHWEIFTFSFLIYTLQSMWKLNCIPNISRKNHYYFCPSYSYPFCPCMFYILLFNNHSTKRHET